VPDPRLTIEPEVVAVEPGGQARAVVTIANAGTIVEGYRLSIVDEASGQADSIGSVRTWCQILPPEGSQAAPDGSVVVSVYPQQQQTVVLVFAPERGTRAQSGRLAFGVHAVSVVDPAASSVVEGDVELGRVFGLQARLVPVTSSGRWRGRHVVTLSNWGNAPARLRLVPSDPDEALGYLIRPDHVDLSVGASVPARLKVRTRRPTLRGQSRRLPFTVVGEPDPPPAVPVAAPGPVGPGMSTPERPMVDGAFTQKPILSRGAVGVAALAALALAAALVLAWQNRPAQPAAENVPGVPQTPALAAAVSRGPHEVMLSWAPVPDVTGYALQFVDAASKKVVDTADLDAALGAYVVKDLDAGKLYCFSLVAQRGEVKGLASAPQCAKTKAEKPATNTTTTAPGGGTSGGPGSGGSTSGPPGTTTTTSPPGQHTDFAKGQWVAGVYVEPTANPGAEQVAVQRQAGLAQRGAPAKILLTSNYPQLKPTFLPSYVVYLGPFSTRDEALTQCAKVKDDKAPLEDCVPVQPLP
jgi:hypothetical protein